MADCRPKVDGRVGDSTYVRPPFSNFRISLF